MGTNTASKASKYMWLIRPCTNLHVGNENVTSFGLVDKMVQRDVLTTLPCIHSSSLKGALSEFVGWKYQNNPDRAKMMRQIFGSDDKQPADFCKGSHTFFDAHLLFLPAPSTQTLYYQATSPRVLKQFIYEQELLGFQVEEDKAQLFIKLEEVLRKGEPVLFQDDEAEGGWAGDYKVKVVQASQMNENSFYKQLMVWAKQKIVFFSDHDFVELCDDENLPIIARNRLGENRNLWYEQVVPRETVFYTFIQEKDDYRLHDKIVENDLIQIGANATIGYGYCKFERKKEAYER